MMDSQLIPAGKDETDTMFASNNNNVIVLGSKKRVLLVKVHKIDIFSCNVCPKVFTDDLLLEKHIQDHENQYMEHFSSVKVKLERLLEHQCEHCPQSFLTKRDLVLHNLVHIHQNIKASKSSKKKFQNDDIPKPYQCPDCEYCFAVESNLQAHSKLHKPYPHVCHCGVGYYRKQDLLSHQEVVHTRDKIPWKAKTKYQGAYIMRIKTEPNSIGPKLRPELLFKSPMIKRLKPKPKEFDTRLLVEKEGENLDEDDTRPEKKAPKERAPKKKPVKKIQSEVKRKREFINHPNIDIKVTSDGMFTCPVCNKLMASKSGLYTHYRIHTGDRPYACDICDMRFTQISGLHTHLKIHIGKKDFVCNVCDKRFYNIHALRLHERTHTGERPYECIVCGKAFSDPSAFQRHQRIHMGDKRYQCSYCPKAFTDASGLIAHRKRHRNEKKYPCDECEKSFFNRSALMIHKATHSNAKKFKCDYNNCNKSFKLKTHLTVHMKSHMGLGYKKCPYCSKNISRVNIGKHIQSVHKGKPLSLTHDCEKCDMRFLRLKNLREHVQLRHNMSVKYECDNCAEKFATKKMLRKHILTRHVCLKCDLCNVYFASLIAINAHRILKKCSDCGEELFCKGNERNHKLQYHVTIKYECELCNQVFHGKTNLRTHMASHRIPKPKPSVKKRPVMKRVVHKPTTYECSLCLKEFKWKTNLKRHIERCHNDEQFV